jgi:hypothetical protein
MGRGQVRDHGGCASMAASVVDEDQLCGLRVRCASEVLGVTLASANSAGLGDPSTRVLSHRGHSKRVFVDIHAEQTLAIRD